MSRDKITIFAKIPLLHGVISTAKSTCGKQNCACKATPPKLHGTYYRWTGVLNGKRTTKTISKEVANECLRRIRNYKNLQTTIRKLLKENLKSAPWEDP